MKRYDDYNSVEELLEAYNIKSLSSFLIEADNKDNDADVEDKIDKKVMVKTLEEIKLMLPVSDSINVPKLLKKYYKLLKSTPVDVLSQVSLNERESVKDFILDSNFSPTEIFSPHVIQSLVSSIEAKINDN